MKFALLLRSDTSSPLLVRFGVILPSRSRPPGPYKCLPPFPLVFSVIETERDSSLVEGFIHLWARLGSIRSPPPPLLLLLFLPRFLRRLRLLPLFLCLRVNTGPAGRSWRSADCLCFGILNYGGKNPAVRARRQLVLG